MLAKIQTYFYNKKSITTNVNILYQDGLYSVNKDSKILAIENDVKNLYQKGETSTTTVDPKTGKKIVKRTGGVTDSMVSAKINKYYDENNQDFLEAKSLDATDYFSQWMRS